MTPIRVLIADDHALVREGIRHVLDLDHDIVVIAEAANGREAVELALSHRPDVAVLDISMPEESGLSAAARLRSLMPELRILLLSMHEQAEYVRESMRVGCHGYILKDSAGAELRAAIRTVHEGGTFVSPGVKRVANDGDGAGPPGAIAAAVVPHQAPNDQQRHRDALMGTLTARERDVLRGVARGLTNKAIGAERGISPRTVEAYRESLMRKLNIHSVAGLTRFALEVGLIGET